VSFLPSVKDILERCDIDVLLLSTDSIIHRSVFSVPRRATLNAHPGQLPQFRGLGGLVVQVSRGVAPSMSVHIVNEGIDTGPVLLREDLPERILWVDQSEREQVLTEWQAKLFALTLRKMASGNAKIVDTFLEPSNMTRGVSRAFAECTWAESKSRMSG
jgi:folate-dependent phosphoribosylglycinamide formyltransferase PurN